MDKTKLCLVCIGKKVKELRDSKGLTQFELATDLDTDKCLISALERGVYNNITIRTLSKLADYFSVEIEYFLK